MLLLKLQLVHARDVAPLATSINSESRKNAGSFRCCQMPHLCLLTLGGDGVDLVDEDDGGRVLLRLLERLPQVALRLAGQLRHDLRAVDEEEEGAWQTAGLDVRGQQFLINSMAGGNSGAGSKTVGTVTRIVTGSNVCKMYMYTSCPPVSLATARAMSVLPEPGGPAHWEPMRC